MVIEFLKTVLAFYISFCLFGITVAFFALFHDYLKPKAKKLKRKLKEIKRRWIK